MRDLSCPTSILKKESGHFYVSPEREWPPPVFKITAGRRHETVKSSIELATLIKRRSSWSPSCLPANVEIRTYETEDVNVTRPLAIIIKPKLHL